MKVVRTEELEFEGAFFTGKFVNKGINTLNWISYPKNAEQFEQAAQELRHIRKTLWPEYLDTTVTVVEMKIPKRYTGRVKWFNDAKGIGIIKEDLTNREVYVHFSAIEAEGFKTLAENDKVSFEIKEAAGAKALNVQKI